MSVSERFGRVVSRELVNSQPWSRRLTTKDVSGGAFQRKVFLSLHASHSSLLCKV